SILAAAISGLLVRDLDEHVREQHARVSHVLTEKRHEKQIGHAARHRSSAATRRPPWWVVCFDVASGGCVHCIVCGPESSGIRTRDQRRLNTLMGRVPTARCEYQLSDIAWQRWRTGLQCDQLQDNVDLIAGSDRHRYHATPVDRDVDIGSTYRTWSSAAEALIGDVGEPQRTI